MPPRLKLILNSWWFPTLIFLALYLTGLHTPVIVLFQRGLLATGLLLPDTVSIKSADQVDSATVDLTDLYLSDAQGRPVNTDDLVGKVVFLNLWASWCPPCLAEMPNIEALYADYAANDRVAFVLLNVEADSAKGRALMKRKGYRFPVYYLQAALPERLASGTLPTTYVIAPSGEVVLRHLGMARYDTNEFRSLLDSLAHDRQSPLRSDE